MSLRHQELAASVEKVLDDLRSGKELLESYKNRFQILSQRQQDCQRQLDVLPSTIMDSEALKDQLDDLRHMDGQVLTS